MYSSCVTYIVSQNMSNKSRWTPLKKGKKKGGKKADDSFKIHDGSDFEGSGDELDTDDSDDEKDKKKKKTNADSDEEKNGSKNKKGGKKKKSKDDVQNEAFEDSDDGDGEGREIGYMSDESSEEEEEEEAKHDIHGVENDEGNVNVFGSSKSTTKT